MGHCYGNDLRRRVVEAVTGGLSARGAAARFRVAPATAIHWRWRETGSIEPDRQGQPPGSKLDAHEAFILALVAQTKAMTLAEIGEKLAASHGVRVCPSTGLALLRQARADAQKKAGHAAEQRRPDVLARRRLWFEDQAGLAPERLIFIDETGASMKMARLRGWSRKGERCRAAIPHGHWKTTTLTAGLRLSGLAAPMHDHKSPGAVPKLTAVERVALAHHRRIGVPRQHHAAVPAAQIAGAGPGRKHLAVPAPDLPVEPRLRQLRRHRR